MPKEGHKSVTIETYRWEQMQEYFSLHKAELRKRGIKSASALVSFWLSEALANAGTKDAQPSSPVQITSKKFCRYCGAQNKTDAIFCEKCGRKIS